MIYNIKKLTSEMANDYVTFFEERGLPEGDINKGCYCVWHHWTDSHENERAKLPYDLRTYVKRDYAVELIKKGRLNGFAAYYDNKIVGFCNADLKENYYRYNKDNRPELWKDISENLKILSIVCFVIDINMRGKGIASALLDFVCKYAEAKGFDYIEAYPSFNEFDSKHCGGPFSMYEKQNFSIMDGVVRKKLK